MKTQKTVVTLVKETSVGYTEELRFITEEYPQGGKEYYLEGWEKWEDGHYTQMPNLRYRKFRNAEEGNRIYNLYKAHGYQFGEKYSFTPTEMDMR